MQGKYKKFFFSLFISFLLFLPVRVVFANTEFMVSWKSAGYVPDWYLGKSIPSNDTKVNVAFDLLDNGAVVDVSKIPVRWYVDGKLMKNENTELGAKNFSFYVPIYSGGSNEVKITIPNYKGRELNKIIEIPSGSPQLVIESDVVDNQIKKGITKFSAWPFFFNFSSLSNLNLIWKVNEDVVRNQQDPLVLNLNIGQGSTSGVGVLVEATARNLRNFKESVNKKINLEVK